MAARGCGFVLLLALAAAHVHAGPRISVRGRTHIELDPVRRTDYGIRISGTVMEPAVDSPVAFVPVVVSVDGYPSDAITDSRGRFGAEVAVGPGRHYLLVEVPGNDEYSGASYEMTNLDPAKQPLTLIITAPAAAANTDREVSLLVRAETDGYPVAIRAEVFGGPADADGELERLSEVFTDEQGAATVTVPREVFGPPGRKRVEIRFPGDAGLDAARDSDTFIVRAKTAITFDLGRTDFAHEDRITGRGTLTDDIGLPVPDTLVTLEADGKAVADSVTDEGGEFELSVAAAELGPGPSQVQAVFNPSETWLTSSRSKVVAIAIAEARPVPVGYTITAFAASALALLAFVTLRTRPWSRWLRALRSEDSRDPGHESDADERPPHTGLAMARPSLVSTLRRAHDHGFTGLVADSITGRGIPGATLTIGRGPDSREANTDQRGRFDVDGLPAGQWDVAVRADGYVTERFTIACPHRGELRNARVDLLPVRERIFTMYRAAAGPYLPQSSLWGIWTPRQIVDHVRSGGPAPSLSRLTDYVEEAYFSQRTPNEDCLPDADRLVRAAVAEAGGRLPLS